MRGVIGFAATTDREGGFQTRPYGFELAAYSRTKWHNSGSGSAAFDLRPRMALRIEHP